ncbi:aminomethyltransferase [Neoconidiobolus thromboides FSU 785]|nr:aminomethyltransferase [Neoconidiobolus thromboides FSU 785]
MLQTITRQRATANIVQRLLLRTLASSVQAEVKKTSLHSFHESQGGQMVSFAGWSLPVKYSDLSVSQSHHHTRKNASIFDVSHMLQTKWTGKDRIKFIETLVVGDILNLPEDTATLSLFTNKNGGIIDDTVICKHSDHLYVVSNAGCADKDLAHIRQQLKEFQQQGGDVDVQVIDTHSLLALQGPKAAEALQALVKEDLKEMNFMTGKPISIKGIECHVARVGYTGEDGFEISVPHEQTVELTNLLLENDLVRMAGLGARDSLRLEAGLCLYGHDLNEEISPIEATLKWTIGKRRLQEGGFLGAERIFKDIKDGVSKKRIGLIVQGAPAREGAKILDSEDNEVGYVTSGCPSPSLGKNVAMGYVATKLAKSGTELKVKIRNKQYQAVVSKMPFTPAGYYRKP